MIAAAPERRRSFPLFGSRVQILVTDDGAAEVPMAEALLRSLQTTLTRFDSASMLRRINADPRAEVPVSGVVAQALAAACRAYELSGGLVDASVLPALERAGYSTSRVGVEPADLRTALAAAPARRPARPAEAGARPFSLDAARTTLTREPGVRLDLGGVGKGFAADLAGAQLRAASGWVVDCGGDLRIGGRSPQPRLVEVRDPFDDEICWSTEMIRGAVATSGLRNRIWANGDGYAHHLIDPSTGLPAWTGVVQATALAGTAAEAETLAKTALLSGPERGLELLEERGGLLVTDDGELLVAGAMREGAGR